MRLPTPHLLRRLLSVAFLVAVGVLMVASGAAAWPVPPSSPSTKVQQGKAVGPFAHSNKVRHRKVATPPVVTVPTDQRVEAQRPLGAVVVYKAASAVDAVDGPVGVLCSPGSGSLFPLGSTRVGCTARDKSGNVGLGFLTVSVVDTTPPKLTAPAAIAVAADSASGTSRTNATVAAFLSAAVATDLVDAAPKITTNAASVFPLGTTTVLFTAADASGNRATASSTVTVRLAAPVVHAPPDQHAEAQGPSGATVEYPPATAVDALGRPLLALCSPGSGSLFPLAATQVGCRATDGQGLSRLAFFTVSVVDTTPPKLTAPAAIVVAADSASGTSRTNARVAAFLSAAVATDLVDATPKVTTNAPDLFPVGTTQVVFTASDASGNKATATSSVTVQSATTTAGTTTTGATTTTPVPTGSVLWRGDAETGDLSQWTGGGNCLVQASRVAGSCYGLTNCTFGGYGVGDGDIQTVSSPVHGAGSTKAYKHVIYQQTSGTGCGGDNTVRADLYLPPDTSYGQAAMGVPLQGKEQYWHFAFMLPSVNGQPQQWAQYFNWNALGDMHPRNGANPVPVDFGVVDTSSQHFIYSEHIDESQGCFDCDTTQVAPSGQTSLGRGTYRSSTRATAPWWPETIRTGNRRSTRVSMAAAPSRTRSSTTAPAAAPASRRSPAVRRGT